MKGFRVFDGEGHIRTLIPTPQGSYLDDDPHKYFIATGDGLYAQIVKGGETLYMHWPLSLLEIRKVHDGEGRNYRLVPAYDYGPEVFVLDHDLDRSFKHEGDGVYKERASRHSMNETLYEEAATDEKA